jgi:hypothetical protein
MKELSTDIHCWVERSMHVALARVAVASHCYRRNELDRRTDYLRVSR